MIDTDNIKEFAKELSDALDTPISSKILNQLSSKQRSYIYVLVFNSPSNDKKAFEILDFGKNKLEDKLNNYKLKNKLYESPNQTASSAKSSKESN